MPDKALEILSITADIFAVTGISGAFIFGIVKKSKSLVGFKVNLFIGYVIRTGIIFFVFILIVRYSLGFFDIMLALTNGSSTQFMWEGGKEIQYSLAYFMSFGFGLFFFWPIATIIWTSSLVHAAEFINILLPQTIKIRTDKLVNNNILEILKAEYKTDENHLRDVTAQLNGMIKGNKLTITASNDLAGDPHKGHVKNLIINYRINGEERTEVIREDDTKVIPS